MIWQNGLQPDTKPEFIVVGGPTASGKSAVALELALALNGAIICCDSVQIYRGFDLGSAKPSKHEQSIVPHYLFDEFVWNENCDAAIYASKARRAIEAVKMAGLLPVVVGGTGLYLRALLGQSWDEDIPSDASLRDELGKRGSNDLYIELRAKDPDRAAQLHANDRFRVIRALEINILTGAPVRQHGESTDIRRSHVMVTMNPPRETLKERINVRTSQMIEGGLVEEVRQLLAQGVAADCKPMKSIGYKEVVAMLENRIKPNEMESAIAIATRQYAKRQVTWFKKVSTDSILVDVNEVPELIVRIKDLL